MEWWLILVLMLAGFFVLALSGMPIAFAFLLVNSIAAFLLWGGQQGLEMATVAIRHSISQFYLVPVLLFVLMGEIIFQSGITPKMIGAIDQWVGRMPGRLGLVAVGAGTVFGALTGTSMASTAMLGSALVPEMEKRGYKKSMSLGPILGSGGLAIMIPPSGLAVVLAAMADVSIGKLLIAIIIPGLMMAAFYSLYTVGRCVIQPSIAPPYPVTRIPLSKKFKDTAKYLLPFVAIVFLVTGVIFVGIATPTEASATGGLGCFILVACYRRLNWNVVKKSFAAAIEISVMVLFIVAVSQIFGQILAYTQATREMVNLIVGIPMAPIMIVGAMMLFVALACTVISSLAILMTCVPLFMPIVIALGFDPLWFAVLFLLNMEIGSASPPLGVTLFVMKSVATPGTTMGDINKAVLPYLGCDLVVMALLMLFPAAVFILPNMMWS